MLRKVPGENKTDHLLNIFPFSKFPFRKFSLHKPRPLPGIHYAT